MFWEFGFGPCGGAAPVSVRAESPAACTTHSNQPPRQLAMQRHSLFTLFFAVVAFTAVPSAQ